MAEQHGIGDRPQERGAGKHAQERHRKVAASVDGGGDQADDTHDWREQVHDGWELPPGQRLFDLSFDARHLGDPLRSPVVLLGVSGDSGVPMDDGDRQRERSGQDDTGRADLPDPNDAEPSAQHQGRCGQHHVDPTKEPSIPDAHLAPPCREPQKRQPTNRPLQQHRGGIEADHAGQANEPGAFPRDHPLG